MDSVFMFDPLLDQNAEQEAEEPCSDDDYDFVPVTVVAVNEHHLSFSTSPHIHLFLSLYLHDWFTSISISISISLYLPISISTLQRGKCSRDEGSVPESIPINEMTVNPGGEKINPQCFSILKVLGKGGYGKYIAQVGAICFSSSHTSYNTASNPGMDTA
eukprot:sb/3472899/